MKNILLFAHAFTDCDSVSSIFGKGKQSLLNLIQKESTLRWDVQKFYEPQSTVEDNKEAGERIMLKLFGSNLNFINQCKIVRFSVSVINTKTVNLATLPPTASATH